MTIKRENRVRDEKQKQRNILKIIRTFNTKNVNVNSVVDNEHYILKKDEVKVVRLNWY